MKRTYDYFWKISVSVCLLLLFCFSANAKSKKQEKADHTFYGMYVDVDVLHPILHLFNSDRMGVNADVQLDLWHRLYPTILVGYDWYDASDDYSYPTETVDNLYKVNGLYFKVGAIYNFWKKDFKSALNPIAYFGINYCFSPSYTYEINNYPITNGYWNSQEIKMGPNYQGKTFANWGEVIGGVKAPLTKHLCLGFEVNLKIFLHCKDHETENTIIHQSYAPGFGDQESGKWGFRYTISYFFPFIKK